MNKMQILSGAPQRLASKAVGFTPKAVNPRPSLPGASRRVVSVRAGEGRQPWDFGRFVSTVAFFNEGTLQKTLQSAVDNLAKAISGGSQEQAVKELPLGKSTQTMDPLNPVIPVPVDGIIMVTGATGGVGKRVVAKMLQAGKHVRALVRDGPKAQELLSSLPAGPGGKLELVVADITQRRTLLPEYFRGVRAVVSCTAVKVQPKEGDDADRSKYMQGIKFFDPEIVGDTPETVELLGMRNLIEAVENSLGPAQGIQILKGDGSVSAWGSLDDVVMGGVSSSTISSVPGTGENGMPAMVFRGNVSTDNSGGFASVRSRNIEPAVDAGAFEGLELRVKGNGLRYKLVVRPEEKWDGIGYTHSFDTNGQGEWETIRISFSEFIPVFRAQSIKNGPPLDPSHISSLQLMLSKFEYDGALNPAFKAGQFELPISSITTYRTSAPRPPCFVHVSSAGVTRPSRPGINVDMEPPAVKLNATLGGILDFKLAGEDVVRASSVPTTVVRPCALTEEPRGMPLEFGQGDVIKGKVGREDIAELCCALLSEPSAANCTFEIKSMVPFSQPWQVDASNPPAIRDWGAEIRNASLVPGVTGKTINGVYSGMEPESKLLEAEPVKA